MLRSVKELLGYKVIAEDGDVGVCKDFLFEDNHWSVRHAVVETGHWFASERILISPDMFGHPDWSSRTIPLEMTLHELGETPQPGDDKSISWRYEKTWLSHFSQDYYWLAGDRLFGFTAPVSPFPSQIVLRNRATEHEKGDGDVKLKSANELLGYTIFAQNERAGKLDDIIVDDVSWVVKHLSLSTGHGFSGKKVLLEPQQITEISWQRQAVTVDVSSRMLSDCPVYDRSQPVNREYQEVLYDYEGRPHP